MCTREPHRDPRTSSPSATALACGRGVARGGHMQRLAAQLGLLPPTHSPGAGAAPPGTCALRRARAAAAVRAHSERVSGTCCRPGRHMQWTEVSVRSSARLARNSSRGGRRHAQRALLVQVGGHAPKQPACRSELPDRRSCGHKLGAASWALHSTRRRRVPPGAAQMELLGLVGTVCAISG